ncbi:MAG: UvrD-helicase domain-containing protein, partial [Pseudomonadota bacterium]
MMDPQAALAQTIEAQGQASDPAASAWVSANAGAGKTHVLKMRVLRLLLADVAPARILCLTYTKAAAAEMSTRVFDELAAWATASDTALDAALCDLTGASPNADQRARARRLFARAIETPGGLKIQTIHAFAERLLQRFPLEAGIPPGFEIADERARDMLLDDAVDAMLADAIGQSLGQLQDALNTIVAYADETRFQDILTSALSDPDWLALMSALQTQAAGSQPNQDPIDLYYRARFGMTDDATEADVTEAIALALSDATLADAVAVLSASSGKRDQDLAKALADIRTANDCEDRAARITSALLTAKLEPRSDAQFISKAVRESEPGLTDTLCRARDTVAGLSAKAAQIRTIAATRALLAVTGRVAERFTAAKAEAGVLDFD